MDATEFDATLGGTEHLPYSANSLKFAASRSVEIAAMTEGILRPNKTKLIFQSLPVHMRRRVMSHNCKRLPRKLREGHLEQMKKSGLPPKQKRPSRKYRRRPGNLLEEYNRRQKKNVWLETHIWHAKRFHMIERWGHKLPYAPCDKAFRACYRASSAHCLIQDISYYTPINISGHVESIKDMFNKITDSSTGLSICAKAFINGYREGTIHLYNVDSYPFKYIGKVNFIWVSEDNDRAIKSVWLFVHPSQKHLIETVLTDLLCNDSDQKCEDNIVPEKRRKLMNNYSKQVQIKVLTGAFNRFRLTGRNSHSVLVKSLKCITDLSKIKNNDWIQSVTENYHFHLLEKFQYWDSLTTLSSPSQLPSHAIVGLTVRDPRLSRPSKRTKAKPETDTMVNLESILSIPPSVSTSPLWDTKVCEIIKKKRLTNGQFIEHVTKTQLVPGEIFEDDPVLQSVPVVLVQRPGSQESNFKKIGYGSGWDIIVPSGYGLPFWQTFIMFGARSGGLRETESLAFEMGECYLPPDSKAGNEEEKRLEMELKDRYFRLPPSKRVNYIKLAVTSPFICPWKVLLKDWSDTSIEKYFVLRNKKLLNQLQDCVSKKKNVTQINNYESCLVPIYLQMTGKGSLKRHALICLPHPGDIANTNSLVEPHHEDPNEKLRKQKRSEHAKHIKRWRRKRIKLKKNVTSMKENKMSKRTKHEPSEYVKAMRELWLPSNVESVRNSASRQIIGYLTQGAFSFAEAHSCGVGYIAFNALSALIKSGFNQVLVRNTSSRKYRLADLQILINTC